jgi:hypothetical protein
MMMMMMRSMKQEEADGENDYDRWKRPEREFIHENTQTHFFL